MNYIAVDPPAPARKGLTRSRLTPTDAIRFSPNGEYFFFMRSRGELEGDSEAEDLVVYRTEGVRRWLAQSAPAAQRPAAYRRVTLRSHAPSPATNDVTWDEDGRSVLFRGLVGRAWQAFRLDVPSGALYPLTDLPYPLHEGGLLSFASRGEGLIYFVAVRGGRAPGGYPAEWVKRNPDGSMPFEVNQDVSYVMTHYASYRGGTPHVLQLEGHTLAAGSSVWFAPDGRQAIALASAGGSRVRRLVRIDVETGRVSLLPSVGTRETYSSPRSGTRFAVFWSADATRFIVVNAVQTSSDTQAAEGSASSVLEYELSSGQVRPLEPLSGGTSQVRSVEWLSSGREVLVTHDVDGKPAEGTVYAFNASGVERRVVDASVRAVGRDARDGLRATLAQAPNEPPHVEVSLGSRKATLTEADPALAGVRWQSQQEFQWRESDRALVSGGLVLPPRAPGQRVPLVIQNYDYEPAVFLPDGTMPVDAAQALAARGMAVLQISKPQKSGGRWIAEGPAVVDRIESAVSALDAAGLVDRSRVGLTGFSRAGMQAYYAVTHPGRVRLAAAVGSDFYTGTFGDHLQDAGHTGLPSAQSYYDVGGGGPFWQKKAEWLQHDPSFNVDRVVTPFLIIRHDSGPAAQRDVPTVLALTGAFTLNSKPMDYLYLGDSAHDLHRPLERLAEMEAVIDWMSFWLQGYEDPNPRKAVQYERWRPLRSLQAKSLAQSQPALTAR